MNRLFTLFVAFIATATITIATIDTAEAKRLGSGNSFGSKFSQSNSVKKDTAPQQRNGAAAATPAQQTNMAQKQKMANKGGIAGMIGALAIGGILGAMFFGGAFENVNFMDILLFALIGFIIFKLIKSRMKPQQQVATEHGEIDINEGNQHRENMNDMGSNSEQANSTPSAAAFSNEQSLDSLRQGIAKGFDQEGFTEGAKSCYERLQKAWDEGDVADIRQFVSDHVFVEIQEQIQQRESNSSTEIISLTAELLSAQDLGSKQEAIVMFDAELLEDGIPTHNQEVWHFSRPNNSSQPTWFLEGIQQVE